MRNKIGCENECERKREMQKNIVSKKMKRTKQKENKAEEVYNE